MPRRLPSSALDSQTILTASGTGAVLAANWYIGTSGLGAGATGAGQVVGTLNGPLTGLASRASVLDPGKALNGTTFTGSADITVPVNTTSIATSGVYYPLFVPSSTAGNQQASTSVASGFTFDPNTKNLVVAGTVTGSNLSGTHSGTSSGTNTGDQTLPTTLPHDGTALSATTGLFTGHIDCVSDANAGGYGLRIRASVGYDGTYAGITFNNPAGNQNFGSIYADIGGVGVVGSFRTGGDITVASGGFFKGNGSQLTNLPFPVTSVNGQTGAVTVTSGVTSVNGSTGAVTVSTLYDSFNGSYFNVQQMYKSLSIQPGGYLGDKFASTGLQNITGITITNFSSADSSDPEGGAFSYTVSFSITYSNAWFETYAPGYDPSHLRMVVVRQGDFAYGTHWVGYPTTTTWAISNNPPIFRTTQSLAGFPAANMTSTTNVTWTTNDGTYVQGRGASPYIWPSSLKLTTYYAR